VPTKLAESTRIDAPHVIGDESSNAPKPAVEPVVVEPAGEDAAIVARQLRVQADQLAERLRTRQANLDRREAQLNVREAQFENDTRAARLWLSERQAELEARAASTNQPHPQEHVRDNPSECYTQREQSLADEESRLAERKKQLAEAERRCAELQHQTEQLHQALQKDREEFNEQRRRDRQEMVARERLAQQELDRKRGELARRGEQVDRCRAAMEQLREEVGQMHRSTLEMRMAAEELWSQLAGAAPPAALVRSMGEIRRRLAEHYRGADAELADRKQELVALRVELRRRHEQLAEEKRRLERWLADQEQDVEQRAARLVAREQELDAQQADFRDQAAHWEITRLTMAQEIHRLRRELGAMPTPAADSLTIQNMP